MHTDAGSFCTHGDDTQFAPGAQPAAHGDDMDVADSLVASATAAGSQLSRRAIPCREDGSSGNRIEFYYAYLAGHRNRLAAVRSRIIVAIEQANEIVYESARQSGGYRALRVLTDEDCNPVIKAISLPAWAGRDFGKTITAAKRAHLTATDRKYVLFVDTAYYCGVGTLSQDDQPGPRNASNAGPSWARVDTPCWSGTTTAHEIFHMLGAVQRSAPHYDRTGHCTDDYDLMCYQSAGGARNYVRCHSSTQQIRLDCAKDDYFNTAPGRRSYLARHWNTASSSFLYGGGPGRPTR